MTAMLASISEKLIRALPPAFVILVLLNIGFLGTSIWVFQHNVAARNELLTKIVNDCLLTKSPRSMENLDEKRTKGKQTTNEFYPPEAQ
jgi:hypothetical protein